MRNITCLLLVLALAPACDDADLEGPEAEVKQVPANLDLPAVPDFDMPEQGGAIKNPRELRLLGRKYLEQEIEVKGYVTWIYDCVVAGGSKGPIPGDTDEAKKKAIEKDPTLCHAHHFIINDSPDGRPDTGVWVVHVPKPPRPDQKKARRLSSKDIKEWMKHVPQVAVGDEITVKGTWKVSYKGFANSRGLLVYKESDKAELPAPEEGPGSLLEANAPTP